ncbi:MAG TPA: transglycosylase domain-containing protein [Mycobacteriales bacterium]|nr:transglycosylase domain-containing protein [Mycobacteriales bacterium]
MSQAGSPRQAKRAAPRRPTGRRGIARYAPRPKQVLWGTLIALVAVTALTVIAYVRTTIPNVNALSAEQATTIYYSNGHKLATIGDTNRIDVPLSQVPLVTQHAVLAAEDRNFYSEPGISPTGIIRALLVDLKGGDISQGGSTITQQYVKNAYLSPHRSLTRKLKEILIATKLARTTSKSTILDDYLNTIYYGRGAYGIEAAAKAYFGVDVSKLNAAQSALIAAVIRGPSYYDPIIKANRPAAKSRWQYVIDGMVSKGWLTQAQADRMRFPAGADHQTKGESSTACLGEACFIRDAVEYELRTSDGISQAQLDLGGYKIVTTIDQHDEQALINAEHAIVPKNDKGTPESGAASIVPGDGAIRALYGGRYYCGHTKLNPDSCIDLSGATGQWARPPGSSFKAFTLIAALQKGISLSSIFDGPPTVDVDGTEIHNSSPGEACYGCTLLSAFAQSINTVFVPLAQQVGPQNVVDAAYKAGIPKSRHLSAVPDITLGPDQVSPLDLADAYATIAAQGKYAAPYLVKSVTTVGGQRIYRATPHVSQVFPADVMSDATYAMEHVLEPGGTAYGHALSGRPSAGKTGTTDNNTNAWFTGFTPQLCTSVWIGNVNRDATVAVGGVGEVFGGTLPAEVWQDAMNAALDGQPVESFPAAAAVGTPEVSTTAAPPATATSVPTITVAPSGTPPPVITSTPLPTLTGGPTATPPLPPTPTETPTQGALPPGPGNQAKRE